MSNKTIGIIVGSLRKESFNKSIANYVASLIPAEYEAKFIDISDVDMFNQDLEDNPPTSWTRLREDVKAADAYLFFTPEYNRSVPAVLKNVLDVASRPYGQNVWAHKPAGIVSVSMGGIAAFGANHHLRQTLAFLDVYPLQQPEAYIGNVMGLLDDKGNLVNEDTKNFMKSYVDAFTAWVEKF
ncbi:MAG TPA: NADPH-dependent FMN reductase [Lachnospiraceae bacterium]|uniref:NADPH-dependent FMN reductase n=1 Tax=Anaerosporobacter sp. TaxID=1872529 RepID=UPI000EE4AA37|nr:NAD(P)H-dependent oxidoreductase [Anaerosporobacter sp.]HAB60521.1 NADPH-dependent FMN reductase [Lachnospiraceae bacterium]